MMEVKHSPTVPLLDYVSANSDSNSGDTSALLKNAGPSSNLATDKLEDELLQNGANLDDELDFQDATDDVEAINSDLEDALLADDDLLAEPKTNFSLENLDKAENSTDPGDDLDKLLSKINDVVEGEIETDDNETKDLESQLNGSNEQQNDKENAEENVNETKAAESTSNKEPMEVVEETKADLAEDVVMKEVSAEEQNEEEPAEKEEQLEAGSTVEDEEKNLDEQQPEENQVESEVKENETAIEEQDEKQKNEELPLEEDKTEETTQVEDQEDITEKSVESVDLPTKSTDESVELPTTSTTNEITSVEQSNSNSVAEASLEEGEIVDDKEECTKNKEEDEIFTLVLDDDDEEDVEMTESNAAPTKTTTADKHINDDEEIVCLDDDDDDEITSTTAEKQASSVVESKEIETAQKTEEIVVEAEASKSAEALENENDGKSKEIVVELAEERTEEKTAEAESAADKTLETDTKCQLKENDAGAKVADEDSETKLAKAESKVESTVADSMLEKEDTVIELDESKDSFVDTNAKESTTESKDKVVATNETEKEENITAAAQVDENKTEADSAKNKASDIENEGASKSRDETASKSQDETVSNDQKIETPISENQTAKNDDDLISDNTDNACDGLENAKADEKPAQDKTVGQVEDDARSDSSGSNLLQEGQAPSERAFDEADLEDAECELDDGDDVELLDGDVEKAGDLENKEVDDEDMEIPPAKRLRLSTDSNGDSSKTKHVEEISSDKSENNEKSQPQTEVEKSSEPEKMEVDSVETESKEKSTNATTTTQTTINLKRSFLDANETEDQKSDQIDETVAAESALKKPKTSDEDTTTPIATKSETEEKADVKSTQEASKSMTDEMLDVKQERLIAVPSNKPIPLYPPPKFEETPKKLSLDFLQRFRKSFNQMTKNDLEELVLQKVVEALVYENQFADLRVIIEKQEKVIGLHRSKLAQLVKQYRDLEMVHTRVVKDMREKNSQYLMPVRITRAVGLQVSSPTIRNGPIAQVAPNNVASSPHISPAVAAASGMMRAPPSVQQQQQQAQQQQQKRLASPQRPQTAASSNIMLPSSTTTSPAASSSVGTPNQPAQPVRRGCMQKVTAQRPVNGTNVSSTTNNPPMASIPASSYSRPLMSKPTPATSADNATRVLNKNANQAATNNRARYSGGSVASPSPVQQAQQAKSPPQILNRQPGAANVGGKINAAAQNKLSQQTQFQRSHSSPTVASSSAANAANKSNTSTAYMEQYKNSFNQAMPTVSITPARPKDKSVIDLTDEDDLPTSAPPPPPPSMTPRARASPQNQPNANNRQNLPPSLTRMPNSVSVRPQIAPRQLSSMQAQKNNNTAMQQQSSTTITTASGMSITRVAVNQANPATQRLRYTHPAALPPTPPQTFNPTWKLPPPRPTIRISNLDNGIVISWTMEEPLDRHAEVTTYQIYAYQETNAPPSTESWRHVGDVKAMLLPMAVTLTQFQEDQRYFFSVRAIDTHQRYGAFSAPKTWN